MNKKVLIMICIIIFLVYCIGCFNKNDLVVSENRKDIDFIAKSRSGDYWNTVRAGAEAGAKEFNVNLNFVAPDYEQDIEGQIMLMNKAIDRNVNSIVLAANDYDELTTVTEKAYSNKIPVIVVDSDVNTNKVSSIIATDNFLAGQKAAEKAIELLGSSAKIAVISYVKGSASAEKREKGLFSVLEGYPAISIVAKEYSLSDEKIAAELTRRIIEQNQGIDGFIALNDRSSQGVAQVVEDLNLGGKVKIIAFDCTPQEVEYIDRGIIQATVIQNPFTMGYLGVKYAAMAARGREVPKTVDTGSKLIDKNNMYLPENQKLVFPFFR